MLVNIYLSSFLNTSRWFAAFLVVIAHIRHLVLLDFKDVEQKTIFVKGLYFVTGLGHEAVVIFFVISGFLVGALTLSKWQTSGPSPSAYAAARLGRIYTVLVPALLVGLCLDWIGRQWFNSSELYTNAAQYHTSVHPSISSDMTLQTFVGNLFMMQNILVGTMGSNAPLWSLANEWWYYCIFGFLAAARTGTGRRRYVYALFGFGIAVALPPKLMLWALVWLLGVAAHRWLNARVWRPHPALGMGVFVVAMVASRLSHSSENTGGEEMLGLEFGRDFLLGVAYVIALVSTSRMAGALTMPKLNFWLADFSYSTYLFHFPALLFLVAAGYQFLGLGFQIQPESGGVIYMTGLTVAVYFYCYAFSRLTESHTNFVRKKISVLLAYALPTRIGN
jgi:peptidoglycan/LPS O-acetylase OafA/YrhL